MATQEHLPSLSPTGEEAEEPGGRAEAYRERLREALRDPEFRRIEGFPIGKDEDILALSDPPYYTACPNPFLPEIIAAWQAERAALRRELGLPDDGGDNGNGGESAYRREPFAADVSEGKSHPIYNAHSYHTKVPHRAIMRYILHYTDPGDIVFDGFCGTGMTGVAAQLCGDRREVEALGYRVAEDGTIYDGDRPISRLGARKAVLVDLSPAATFIAYNYNTPVDAAAFEREARRILREVEEECGWMYETWHPHCDAPDRVKARIEYVVWSEVFRCPECGGEITFLEQALDPETQRVRAGFECPHCGARLGKAQLERCRLTVFDGIL
ncbi:MAG: DNA methylase, partial [Anaerolineae bacterium]|nr:DNA methylase [Anaerolineae bacterium]